MAPFEIAGAHVDVEHVQGPKRCFQVGADAASPFTMSPGQIHAARSDDRPAAQKGIPIWAAAVMPRTAEDGFHAQRRCQGLYLSFVRIRFRENLLQGDDVGVQVTKDIRNALDGDAAVHAARFVDVIGHNPHWENFTPFRPIIA